MRDVAPPTRPWVGQMRWCDLAFLHWPVSPDALAPLLPPGLAIDTHDGQAWVGVVPFRMEGVRLRSAPPVPTTHTFAELNVRTYVRAAGRAGVWFFSLDAESRLAVRGARLLYNLPYFDARMAVREAPASPAATRTPRVISYDSHRVHRKAPPAAFVGRYGPIGDVYEAVPGTLDHFLVERYCLFMFDARRGLGLLDIDHPPWPLQPGFVELATNTMAEAAGITLPRERPIIHFARSLQVHAWTRSSID
jgi:uncharacterized protein YqjF (DUF2071 family)